MSSVVYVSGTFDLFHRNHLKMIEYGAGLGDTLIVGVSTDELVCSYKNPPAIPFEERIAIVSALKYPDVVIPQRSLEHTERVKDLLNKVSSKPGFFRIKSHGVGKYGRVLGQLFIMDSEGNQWDVNETLITEGHAYVYDGGKKKLFKG